MSRKRENSWIDLVLKGVLISAILLVLLAQFSKYIFSYKYSISEDTNIYYYRGAPIVEFTFKHKGELYDGSSTLSKKEARRYKMLMNLSHGKTRFIVKFYEEIPIKQGILIDYSVPDSLKAPLEGWNYNPLEESK